MASAVFYLVCVATNGTAFFGGAVKKVPLKKQAVPKGTACKIFIEKRLDQ